MLENEFYDSARKQILVNQWTESVLMFKRRVKIYLDNQDLLTIKQKQLP